MPSNQKHTLAFTYEPQRIVQECITSEAGGLKSEGKKKKITAVVDHSIVAISFHFTSLCPVGMEGGIFKDKGRV